MQIYKNLLKITTNTYKRKQLFSYYNSINLSSKIPSFKASDTIITETDQKKPQPKGDLKDLKFGAYATDHMLVIDWSNENGWEKPIIQKFQNFQLSPFNSTLHYAIECFEGFKAFHTPNGIRLFRCDANMHRMKASMDKISLPDFDGAELQKCIEKLIQVDKDWLPQQRGYSLYVRPTGISMENSLGIKKANKARIFCAISPVGPFYPSGFKPIKLYCDPQQFRAAPHGNGSFKVGSNYGPTITTSQTAAQKGYQQVLWLWKDQICEVGVSNIFFLWINEQGEEELVTPRLDEGYILPGITRDSILDITRNWKKFKVTERQIEMKEIIKAIEENRLKEAFGAGTAVTVCPIEEFWYKEKTYKVPINPQLNAGNLTNELLHAIQDIQYGVQDYKDWQTDIKIGSN